jgi:4-cresol dehydrogenase (hydroxylating)
MIRSPPGLEHFLRHVVEELDVDGVSVDPASLHAYGENAMPGPTSAPSAIIFPKSTEQVQTVVRLASQHRVPLYPISTGQNIGLGSRSPVRPGQVVLDLGRHMNKIIDLDEVLGYVVVEPGVTYQAVYDELVRRGDRFMLDTTSGPPFGGLVGNAMDKGAGYGPLFDHFGTTCGLEVVLANGTILRTGDGALLSDHRPNWHVSKYSYGPVLDGLFAQSNFGIVTRLGQWLLPRPPAIRSFHITFRNDDDFEAIIDLCRPLKLSNYVPTLLRVANDIYLVGSEETNPEYEATDGKCSISNSGRATLRARHGLGAWTVSGALYGPSIAALEPIMERIRTHFAAVVGSRYINHDEGAEIAPLRTALDTFSGIPTTGELGLLRWRPGGGALWFTPGTPMRGEIAQELHRVSRRVHEQFGMDYCAMAVCGGRFQRGLHLITFNRQREEEAGRADACYRALALEYANRGVAVGRAPNDYQQFHMDQLSEAFRGVCGQIKGALDPHGILAPGRYGIS